ncbi:Cocaine-and amphetamine-regulated transcript protein, partial [Nibea albiflora]
MDSSGMLRGLLFVGLLSVMCHGQASQEVSAEDLGVDKPEPAADRDLCGMGDRCAMKFGPRIGKLCDCGRGANCNSYLLNLPPHADTAAHLSSLSLYAGSSLPRATKRSRVCANSCHTEQRALFEQLEQLANRQLLFPGYTERNLSK